ncbi:MAG TPA: FHA domain-containing protein [Dokdonella sp.]
MRFSFANGEHADVVVDGGAVSLGNAEGNTLVLPGKDVAPWHARVTVDTRGAVLEVLDPSARTHVNARPVREKALLRSGDILCLGTITIALKEDRDELIDTSVPDESPAPSTPAYPSKVILRGVSGSHFGKIVAVNRRLVVGSDRGCGLVIDDPRVAPRHATIEHVDDAIYLRDAVGGARVNGVRVASAILHPGDQIAFERSHFVVEAPGLPLRGASAGRNAPPITETLDAVRDEHDDAGAASQHAIWWLIGAAALIALVLFLIIHRGF